MNDASSQPVSPSSAARTFDVRVLRQDRPDTSSYWETHRVNYEPGMNCISVLQKIAEQATTADGKRVAPVVWECNCLEEVCGACTMVINGRARQACTALVDKLLEDVPEGIELRPLSKFPVLRDLMVDRARIFETLKRVKGWLPVDNYYNMGKGPRQSQDTQQIAYQYSQCMSCGCCLEACPQFLKADVTQRSGESDEDYRKRQHEVFRHTFVGANAIAQVELFNSNPIGAMNAGERLDAITGEGGIQTCGNAQNCVRVCPKEIPLTRAIARAGRNATWHTLKTWFDR